LSAAATRTRSRHRGRRVALFLGTILLLTLATAWLLDRLYPLPLPDIGADAATVVLARDGEPLRAFADARGVWRYPVRLEDVPDDYLDALLHYEDRRFRHHLGIDPLALVRAGGQWLVHRRIVSGGSTLTMQVARLIEPTPRSLVGKLRQMLRALQLEWHLDKDAILTLYLDYAPFGGTLEGAQAASYGYFGKPLARVSPGEAALLAVLPQAPSRLRPDRHPQAARAARDKVLDRLARDGVWPAEKIADARDEAVVARRLRPPMHAALAAQRLRDAHPRQRRIASTLDAELQRRLEDMVGAWIERLPPRSSAAVLIADAGSGELRAYVGAGRFGDGDRFGHLDMASAWRSPGSTLKPFLFGMALDEGLIHGRSLLIDAPQDFDGYAPGNFDQRFRGPVDATSALQQSLNVPAVALMQALGPQRFSARMAHAGIPLRLPASAKPNLAMILGGTEARLEDLLLAYLALHRDGEAVPLRLDADAPPAAARRLLSPGAAWIVRDMLQSAPRPGEASGRFDTSGRVPLAWKTGTSYGFRDAWALGSSPGAAIGVWVGRPDGTPMPGHYGAVSALPLLLAIADGLPRELRAAAPARPDSVQKVDICWPLGAAATDTPPTHCRRRFEAWTLDGAVPPTLVSAAEPSWQSLLRYRRDPHSGRRLSARCRLPHRAEQVEIVRWPTLALPWLDAAERASQRLPPLAADCVEDHPPREALRLTGLRDGSRIRAAPNSAQAPQVELRVLGAQGEVRWLLNGRLAGRSRGDAPFRTTLDQPGPLSILALDQQGGYARIEVEVLP